MFWIVAFAFELLASLATSEIFTATPDESNQGWLMATSTVTGNQGRIPCNYVRIEGEGSSSVG